MRPIRLKLEGFIGIASGLGKPAIEINFAGIDSALKMVALAGPNGAGKTTIMDNLHPYRVMPSRATTPVPTAFSYYDHLVEGSDGLKELDWEHEGSVYRSVIRMKASIKTKKQEAYLFVKQGDDFLPYSNKSGLVSDGKADNYDKAIEAIIGKPEVFFTSLFSAQSKKPIGAMTVGEVKTLMGSMLGMEGARMLSAKAAEVVKGLKPHLAAVQAQTVPLQQSINSAQKHQARRLELQTAVTLQAARIEAGRTTARDRLASWVALDVLSGQQEHSKAKRHALDGQLAGTEAENEKQRVAFLEKLATEKTQTQSQLDDALQAVRVAQSSATGAQEKVTDAQSLVARAPAVATAEKNRAAWIVARSTLVGQAEDLNFDATRMVEVRKSVAELRELCLSDKSSGLALKEVIAAAMATAALIAQVPCSGHSFARTCPLLAQARQAESDVVGHEVQINDYRNRYTTTRTKHDAGSRELELLVLADDKHRELTKRIGELDLKIAEARGQMADGPRIEQAQRNLPTLIKQVDEANCDLTAARNALSKIQRIEAELKTNQAQRLVELNDVLNLEVTRLQAAMAQLPAIVELVELASSKRASEMADEAVATLVEALDDSKNQLQKIETAIEGANAQQLKLSQLSSSADHISQEIAHWLLLAKALGTDGIIAMCIDDAGPTISALCNGLLNDCYGGRFVVRLSTQAATAAGIVKESFVIHVEDTLRGEQKVLDDMSGGERVWINECLVRAMALYMAQASGSQFQTLFSDEADGPLDPDRKRQFMAMKRAVLERGAYQREYLVTHTPELLALCDHVIDVSCL
jgi:DNA repair protein SbcC/Rad50